MNIPDIQKQYWDAVAGAKTFTHPVPMQELYELLPFSAKILDYGCGYGRTCDEFVKSGYHNVIGVDISPEMIARGKSLYPNLELQTFDGLSLPFSNAAFDACVLLAVLTCIPTNYGQKQVIAEITRVLRPGGILLVSDYLFQSDAKNQQRYAQYENEFGMYGVFRLSDGGIMRHHDKEWIDGLFSPFEIIREKNINVLTMNGHAADVFQMIARKPGQKKP